MLDLQTTNKDNLPPAVNKENYPPTLEPHNKRSTQPNRVPSTTKRGMWIDETLKLAMDVVHNVTYSLRRVGKAWNIPMNSISDHLNGKTK
jgi:hypothetical protein